jgi:hypothetical protein
MTPCATDALNPGVIMKHTIQALIRNTVGAKRAAAPATALRQIGREELRAVVGGLDQSPKGTWLTTSPKGTWLETSPKGTWLESSPKGTW